MQRKKIFVNNKQQSRRKKELIVLFMAGSVIFSTIIYFTYIKTAPIITSKLPSITINCTDEIDEDNYVDCTVKSESDVPIDAKIKYRGSTVLKYPKKGYRLELSEQKALLGMRKDDDWQLLALYRDHRRMKVKFSMDLWRTLEHTNPTAILPKSKYVKLFLNGEFQGLYLLAEKIDRNLFFLDDPKNNFHTSLILQAKGWTTLNEYESIAWEQDWPNDYEGFSIKNEILSDLIYFINNATDELFFNPFDGIYSKFDKLNLIDFLIFNYFLIHKDFWSKNYYLVRNSYPNKFFLIPWDFDNIIEGRWSLHNVNDDREEDIRDLNYLYDRLMGNKEFMQACRERWIYLREKFWTDQFILDMLNNQFEEIEDILELELEMWTPPVLAREPYNLDDYIIEFFQWFPERLAYCDSYFNEN